MALLNKLFFPSATSVQATSSLSASSSTWTPSSIGTSGSTYNKPNKNQSVHSSNYLNQFPFDGRQVRVLLYRESDKKGRRLLFDSSAMEKVPLNETNHAMKKGERVYRDGQEAVTPNKSTKEGLHFLKQQRSGKRPSNDDFIEVCNDYGYKHNRPNSADITSFGEMVFGALAMSFRGTALKVHWLREPSRVLCSQVFFTPVLPTCNHSPYATISFNTLSTPRTSISSEHGSIDGLSVSSFSVPFSVSVDRHMSLTQSDRSSMTYPLDVPEQLSICPSTDNGARYSSPYSTATDSGYSTSRGPDPSDQWSASYQYSTRSSIGSVLSERSEPLNKFSSGSTYFSEGNSAAFDDMASDGCLQRRIFRNMRTSFENDQSMNDFIGFISDTYTVTNGGGSEGGYMGVPNYRRSSYCANESRSNPEIGRRRETMATKPVARRVKLGLAVCITMSDSFEDEMELFCSEHIALLESMLSRLRARTERAYLNHKDFLQILYQAWQETQQWFMDLFTAPRIKCPVWLSITTSGSKYSKNVAERFMKELSWLLSFADTKDTNFFISTMLTAVLTHHLGWVSTVSPFSCSSASRSETAAAAIEQREKLLQVSQKHPYNALWAQMGDLFGAIGVPAKLARTIIYGTEKLSVERLLNVLTYFIRCGEVRRSPKREDFDKAQTTSLAARNENESTKLAFNSIANMKSATEVKMSKCQSGNRSGLIRNQSSKQNLNSVVENYTQSGSDSGSAVGRSGVDLVRTLKRNEIPNVLAFRDSRFVQQELRIGNFLMDTGIEKNSVQTKPSPTTAATATIDARIRLTVTTPDNVEMCVEEESANCDGGQNTYGDNGLLEAIEIDLSEFPINADDAAAVTLASPAEQIDNKLFWDMTPATANENIRLNVLDRLKKGVHLINRKLDQQAPGGSPCQGIEKKAEERLAKSTSHLSLSDLITQNSMGKSERMTWGIEPIKENLSLEEQIHFDNCQKVIEREHGISHSNTVAGTADSDSAVVFVLGDNEPLVNIKRSNEDLTAKESPEPLCKEQEFIFKSLCSFHQRSYGKLANAKKHSGVKFNFEQYPNIVTNYMRRKNLVLSNYDLLMDKCSKLEVQEDGVDKSPFPASNSVTTSSSATRQSASTQCMACNSCLDLYQTPSNATELEFEADQEHCYPPPLTSVRSLPKVSSTASVDTLKCPPNTSELVATKSAQLTSSATLTDATGNSAQATCGGISKKCPAPISEQNSAPAIAASEPVHLLKLPIPGVKEVVQEAEPPDDMKLPAGFIPSLFLSVSDHFISDMVLQGTFASPNKWEHALRESLTMAAHSASLVSLPAENIGIVADMEKWNVRLISSQPQRFTNDGSQSSPVGMSQLVSTMLETVHAMYKSGISAYECLSFLESKLQEIYLQSETLAAFLLETDFCPLSTLTTAFSLSENDIPLLLSIASIHTPQISNKCGISFI